MCRQDRVACGTWPAEHRAVGADWVYGDDALTEPLP